MVWIVSLTLLIWMYQGQALGSVLFFPNEDSDHMVCIYIYTAIYIYTSLYMLCIYIYIIHNVTICTYCTYTYKRRCSINIYHHVFKKPYNPPSRQNTGASRCKEQSKPLGSRSLKPITSGLKRAFHSRGWWWPKGNWIIPNVEPIYHLCLHTARHSGSRMIAPKQNRCMIGIVKKHSNHLTSAFPLPPCP